MAKGMTGFLGGVLVGGGAVALAFLLAGPGEPGAVRPGDQDVASGTRDVAEGTHLTGRGTAVPASEVPEGEAMPRPHIPEPPILGGGKGRGWRFKRMPDGQVAAFHISIGDGDAAPQYIEMDFGWAPANNATVRELHRLAHDWADVDGAEKRPTPEQIATWLRRGSPAQTVRAIGHALRVVPPALDALAHAATRRLDPKLRGVALSELARHPEARPRASALVLEASRGENDDLRLLAVDLLASIGPAGVDRAQALLEDPRASSAAHKAAARAFVKAPDLARRLPALRDPVGAWRVAATLAPDKIPEERRAAVGAALGALVEERAPDPAWRGMVYAALPHLPALEARESVVRVATDARVSRDARVEAQRKAFGNPRLSHDDHKLVLQDVLANTNAPPWYLVESLRHFHAFVMEDPVLKGHLIKWAQEHEDVWVRKAARDHMASLGLQAPGRIEILRATYGKPGHLVVVTNEVRALLKDGRLSVPAHNGLKGDPYPGHQKDLIVEFTLDGVPGIRVVREGQTLKLPD